MRGLISPASPPAKEWDWRLRLRAWVARRDLDREIAAGAYRDGNPVLELRALQLSRTAERRAIAVCLANILDAAEECQADPGTRLTLDHHAVIGARRELVALIALLRSELAVDVRGVALARLLTEDPASPLFRPCADGTLQEAVAEIADAL